MAYNPNIPQPTDKLSDSQANLLENFEQLNTYLNVNHTPIDGTSNQGKHKFITLPNQTSSPGTLPTEAAIFSQQGTTSLTTELVWQRQNNGDSINFTEFSNTATDGWTRLPSGILMKWMNVSVSADAGTNVSVFMTWPTTSGQPVFTDTPFQFIPTILFDSISDIIFSPKIIITFTGNLTTSVVVSNNQGSYPAFTVQLLAFGLE